jgi:argininosuccinate synthase
MDAFINKTQEQVSGEVVVKLYKGNIFSVSISSPNSLYNPNLAGFTMGEEYNQKDAEGFIKIFGLPMKVFGGVRGK